MSMFCLLDHELGIGNEPRALTKGVSLQLWQNFGAQQFPGIQREQFFGFRRWRQNGTNQVKHAVPETCKFRPEAQWEIADIPVTQYLDWEMNWKASRTVE